MGRFTTWRYSKSGWNYGFYRNHKQLPTTRINNRLKTRSKTQFFGILGGPKIKKFISTK